MQSSIDKDVFYLQFVRGNISRCNGCGKRDLRGEDGKPRLPPYDLCIQHKEHVLFENPHTGTYQMSVDLKKRLLSCKLALCMPKECTLQSRKVTQSRPQCQVQITQGALCLFARWIWTVISQSVNLIEVSTPWYCFSTESCLLLVIQSGWPAHVCVVHLISHVKIFSC